MKKSLVTTLLVALVTALGGGVAAAQDERPVPVIVPVDIITCKYNEGKGPADLAPAIKAWNAYVDKSDQKDAYSAWTMHKQYAGPDQEFDFAWLGAWKDGNAMGKGWGDYLQNGGKVQAGFNAVATCDPATNFGSVRHKAPPEGTPGDGVLVFSDCTMADGVTATMVADMMKSWVAVLDSAGIESGIFHWYPIFGGGGERTFDFKSVTSFANYQAFGKMYQAMTNGGLYRKNRAIFGDSLSCDVARVYNAKNHRYAELRD